MKFTLRSRMYILNQVAGTVPPPSLSWGSKPRVWWLATRTACSSHIWYGWGYFCLTKNAATDCWVEKNMAIYGWKKEGLDVWKAGNRIAVSRWALLTTSLPFFIVDLSTFKVYPRSISWFNGNFRRCQMANFTCGAQWAQTAYYLLYCLCQRWANISLSFVPFGQDLLSPLGWNEATENLD